MKTINVSLSKRSIKSAINELERYKANLKRVSHNIVDELLQIGIQTGELHSGKYKGYIVFESKVEQDDGGYVGALISKDREKIIRYWYYNGEPQGRMAEVSPSLMSEFGSGQLADVVWKELVGQVGQGTFPEQKHAFDPTGWSWTDENGKYHHSYGEAPTYPMHNAWLEMMSKASEVARRNFEFFS